jgi:hypothetical protein
MEYIQNSYFYKNAVSKGRTGTAILPVCAIAVALPSAMVEFIAEN